MFSYEDFFTYEPRTGVVRWKSRDRSYFNSDRGWKIWNTRYAGKPAGSEITGYIYIRLFKKNYAAHHIAYYLQTGEHIEAPYEIDHINGIRSDNRWCNIRKVTRLENARNRGYAYLGNPEVRPWTVR